MQRYLYRDLAELEKSHWWHLAKRRLVITLIKDFKIRNPKILDVGCGTGGNLEELGKIGKIYGIDSSKEAIKFCQKRGLANITVASSYQTGFADSFFDIVTLLDVLEHTNDAKSLKEMRRILTPNGALVISVPAYQWLWSKWDEVLGHKRRYQAASLRKVVESAGFEITKISYLYSFLVLPAFIIRAIKSIFRKNYYPSDFKLSNKVINSIMSTVTAFEQKIFFKFNIPFGTSLICIAKKQ